MSPTLSCSHVFPLDDDDTNDPILLKKTHQSGRVLGHPEGNLRVHHQWDRQESLIEWRQMQCTHCHIMERAKINVQECTVWHSISGLSPSDVQSMTLLHYNHGWKRHTLPILQNPEQGAGSSFPMAKQHAIHGTTSILYYCAWFGVKSNKMP